MQNRHLRLVAPDIHEGDAVGNHCLELVRIFNSNGLKSTAYAERYFNGVSDITQFTLDLSPEDIIFVSFSIYDPRLLLLSKYKNYKICYFHGITPPKYLRGYDPITAALCELGLNQRYLLNNFDHVICNSFDTAKSIFEFINKNKISVLHPITQNILTISKNNLVNKIYSKQNIKIIMLGRVVPHKGIENGVLLLKILRDIGIGATLDIVGNFGSSNYMDYIRTIAMQLTLVDKVTFHGFVGSEQKSFLMKNSDLLFSASYHEGFGIPILEAMGYGLPIIIKKGTVPREISKHCFVYSSLDQAGNMIKNFVKSPTNEALKKNLNTFKSYLNQYSDEYIFHFIQDKIINL